MWSMWDAPSDRDYYGDSEPEPEPECCDICGAREDQACEEWCTAGREELEINLESEGELYETSDVACVARVHTRVGTILSLVQSATDLRSDRGAGGLSQSTESADYYGSHKAASRIPEAGAGCPAPLKGEAA